MRGVSFPDGGPAMYPELIRPRELDYMDEENPLIPGWRSRPVTRKHILAHELGHSFGRVGDMHEDGGLMADSEVRLSGIFSDKSLFKIRSFSNP